MGRFYSQIRIHFIRIAAVLLFSAVVLCFSGCNSCVSCGSSQSDVETVSKTSVSENTSKTGNTSGKSDSKKKSANPIDFKKWQKRNSEIFAWIKVPGTRVDYPILQSEVSDDYYLHRDVDKNYDYSGSIFMQYCNSSEMTDRVSVIYGHNMVDNSMFASLHSFESSDFFKKHRYFYIYLPGQKLTYEIVSAHNYDTKHIMNSYNFAEDEVFKQYLKFIQDPRSLVRNVREKLDHKLTVKDRVVTLSTCLDSGDGRYLIQGVLVKDESTR